MKRTRSSPRGPPKLSRKLAACALGLDSDSSCEIRGGEGTKGCPMRGPVRAAAGESREAREPVETAEEHPVQDCFHFAVSDISCYRHVLRVVCAAETRVPPPLASRRRRCRRVQVPSISRTRSSGATFLARVVLRPIVGTGSRLMRCSPVRSWPSGPAIQSFTVLYYTRGAGDTIASKSGQPKA